MIISKRRGGSASLLLVAVWSLMAMGACVEQESDKPSTEDWKVIKQNILTSAPQMQFKVNADLEGKVTYLGLDVDQKTIKPGVAFKLTHYWKVHQAVPEWRLFVHLNDADKQQYVNADHKPIGGRYAPSLWKAGEIIRDEHSVTLPADWRGNKVDVYTGLWKGQQRMGVKGPQDGDSRVLAASLVVEGGKPEAPAPVLANVVATKATKAPKVDGKLNDEIWTKAVSTGMFVNTMTGAASPVKTEAKIAWDDKNLYVAFDCRDTDVWGEFKKRDDKLWTQEAVEMFIDANGDGKDYLELQVSPLGTQFDSFLPSYRKNQNDWNGKWTAKVAVDGTINKRDDQDKGWTVELSIPWTDMKTASGAPANLPPKVGDSWRVNFFRMDLPKDQPQIAVGWSAPLVGDFHKLDRFAHLNFGDDTGKFEAAATVQKLTPEQIKEATAVGSAVGRMLQMKLNPQVARQIGVAAPAVSGR